MIGMYEEKKKGPTHCCVASVYAHLGILFIAKKDYKAAEEVIKKAWIMKINLLGKEHPHVGLTNYDMAITFWKQFKFEDCMYLLQESHRVLEMHLGNSHPYVRLVRQTIDNIVNKLSYAESILKPSPKT